MPSNVNSERESASKPNKKKSTDKTLALSKKTKTQQPAEKQPRRIEAAEKKARKKETKIAIDEGDNALPKELVNKKQDTGSPDISTGATLTAGPDGNSVQGNVEKPPTLSAAERAAARKRLLARLNTLATQRKGNQDDKPVRSRSELIALRQEKEKRRRALKKAEKEKVKAATNDSAESEATRLIGGIGTARDASPGAGGDGSMDFSYSRLTTDDAPRAKKKRDLRGHLAVAEARDRRLAGFDAHKRGEIENRDAWGAAAARVAGEKTKTNSRLLRASAKRIEKRKKKSAREWQQRQEGVEKGLKARQEKRTRALQQRRPGFEGSKRSHIAKGRS